MNYDMKNLKGDIFGGITAGIVALPLALAFGVQSGLGAIYGLYGAMFLGMIAALLGGTNTQVSGPTGPMTVVTAMVVASAIKLTGSLEAGMGIVIASFMLAGIFLMLFGFLRIGKSIRYMPYPVVSGFMSGIGVIIILFQIYPLLGSASAKSTVDILLNISAPLSTINYDSLGLGLLTIAIIYLLPKATNLIPSILVALIASTIISILFKLNVDTIGSIPEGLPQLRLADLYKVNYSQAWMIVEFAATLAALSAIDSLLTSVIADNITKTKHNSNKELIGQGIGNLISGLFGGLPGAGATMRTVININSGGRTKLSGFIHGIFLILVLLGLGKYVSYIPLSVLAGILLTVGIGIIDYRGFKHLARIPKKDAYVLLIVLLITVFGSLLHAVVVGLVLACVLFMKQASDLAEEQTTTTTMTGNGHREKLFTKVSNQIYVKSVHGPLFFGFTSKFQEMVKNLGTDLKVLILQMDKVPSFDQSGLYALEEVILSLHKKNIIVLLCDVQPQPMSMLEKIDIVPALVPPMHIFRTFEACEQWLHEHLEVNDDLNQLILDLKTHKEST